MTYEAQTVATIEAQESAKPAQLYRAPDLDNNGHRRWAETGPNHPQPAVADPQDTPSQPPAATHNGQPPQDQEPTPSPDPDNPFTTIGEPDLRRLHALGKSTYGEG